MHKIRQIRFTCFLILFLAGIQTFLFCEDWPAWRYDSGRTAVSPEKLPEELHLSWVRRLPPPDAAWPETQDKLQFDESYEPIVMDHTLFVPSMVRDSVTAFDTGTGEEKWRFHTGGPVRFAPVGWKDRIFFTSDDGFLYCLGVKKGNLLWKVRGGPEDRLVIGNERLISMWPARGAPVIYKDTLYFAAGIWPFMGTFIHAVNPETGEILWTNSGSGSTYLLQQHYSPAFAGVAPQGYPAVTEDHLFISGGRTVPACYDRKTGRFLYYEVSDRTFGNACGGYGVSAMKDKFFNGGIMYRASDGTTMAKTPATVFTGNEIIGVDDGGRIVGHSLVPEEEKYTDRRGKERIRYKIRETRKWEAEEPIKQIFLMAGGILYGQDKKGEIVAVEITGEKGTASIRWRGRIEGEVFNMLAANERLFVICRDGTISCFSGKKADPIVHEYRETPLPEEKSEGTETFRKILEETDVREGYCLVLGVRNGGLIEEALRSTSLHIIGIDPDEEKVESLRKRYDGAGLYGKRVALFEGDPMKLRFPPHMASLILSDNPDSAGLSDDEKIYDILRPYGGTAILSISGEQRKIQKSGPLPGAAWWTHQNGDPGNTVVSRDKIVKSPIGLLWFGGSSNENILPRHGHGPTPQVAGGRLVIEGPDSLRAMDVYTGRIIWEREIPGIGEFYNNTSHEPGANAMGSNFVTLQDSVYVAFGKKILVLDPETGGTVNEFTLPGEGKREPADIGYIGVSGEILVAGVNPGTFYTDYEFTSGEFRWMKADKKAKLLKLLKGCKDFTLTKRGEKESDRDYLTGNLNRLLEERRLVDKLPGKGANPEKIGEIQEDIEKHLEGLEPGQRPGDILLKFNRLLLEHYEVDIPRIKFKKGLQNIWTGTASGQLAFLDRKSGKVLRTIRARHFFLHNGIAMGGGRIFLLDTLPYGVIRSMKRRGLEIPSDFRLLALDLKTGKEIWVSEENIFGTWLGYTEEHDILLQAGRSSRDMLPEPDDRMITYRGKNGGILWDRNIKYSGPCLLHGKTIFTQTKAFELMTGNIKTRKHPLTGLKIPWSFSRNYGCNTVIASENLLTFRSAAAGYYDLTCDGGTGNLGGFKSGCTSNLICADGVLSAPDYTRTCTCSYQNQSSLGLVHDPDVETWTFNKIDRGKAPVERLGLNFGAPGDRMAENRVLWLDYPSVGGPSPDPEVEISVQGEKPQYFRHHSSFVKEGDLPWVAASGVRDVKSLKITLGNPETRKYRVRMVFAEFEERETWKREAFDVLIQGKKVLEKFNILKEGGGPGRSVIREFPGVEAADILTVSFEPTGSSLPFYPLLCGIEIMAEKPE